MSGSIRQLVHNRLPNAKPESEHNNQPDIVAALEAEIAELRAKLEAAEREIKRRKGDPVTRLHNICQGIHDDPLEKAEARAAQLEAALRPFVNHLLVETPSDGLLTGKLTLWYLPGGDPLAEPSATQHPRYVLCVENNSLDSASLNSIRSFQARARAALAPRPAEAEERT